MTEAQDNSVTLVADLLLVAAGREPLELRTASGVREKSGSWVVPAEITAECTSGAIRLDFTGALCPHAGEGARDGRLRQRRAPPFPGHPLLRVAGTVGSGSVQARYPRPPRRTFWAWLLQRPRPAVQSEFPAIGH